MVEDESEKLAKELSAQFRQMRESFSGQSLPADQPASLLKHLSDADIDVISKLIAPFLLKQLRKNRPIEISELSGLAESIVATPGLLNAFARASAQSHFIVSSNSYLLNPPDQNRDGAMLFYRKALKKLEFEQYKEARGWLKKSIDLCDDYAPAWEALATALKGCGQHEQAQYAAARASDLRSGT